MEVPKNFSFFGVRKQLPPGGVYVANIRTFVFQDRVAKSTGNPYTTMSAKVEVNGQLEFLNLSLNPKEKEKSLFQLIEQISIQTGKTVDELTELCAEPDLFFKLLTGRTVKVRVNDRGYLDVYNGSDTPKVEVEPPKTDIDRIDPDTIPF